MTARAAVLCVASLVACADHSSRLDHAFDKSHDGDPWSAQGSKSGSGGGDDKGGFDLQGTLSKIKDSIEKPGPYEAPEKSADYDPTKPHLGVLEIHGAIVERESFSFTGGRGTELRELIERLRALSKDDKLTGIVLRVESPEISLPDVVELRAAMHEVRAAGKQLLCHVEAATNATYLMLAACDKIGLAPLGEIMITGPAAMPVHVKPLLDKLGIQADFLHVGAYKGAAEPLTRDAPSKEMEETLGAILDQRYATMVAVIAQDRKLEPAAVKTLIDTAMFSSDQAVAARLIDQVAPFEVFRDQTKAPWVKLELSPEHKDNVAAMLKVARFIGAMPPERPLGDHVAVVYALGNIIDGKGDGLLGARQEIASQTLVAALHAIAADPAVKAVVLRIDSGGGSAQASELIWHAIAELTDKKPVVVSMSDVAASGGYYIASGATKIFALPDTLTGSIGVVGGKIAPAGALAKLGVNTFPMGRGKRATMFASLAPWTDDQKAAVQAMMDATYTTFVGRVAAGRHKTPEDIQPIAQGRVWTGAKAKELGLVDELGGLDAAIADARERGHVDAATELEVYPAAPTLRDVVTSFGGVEAPLGLGSNADLAALRALDSRIAAAAEHMLALVMSFQRSQIQAVTLVPDLR